MKKRIGRILIIIILALVVAFGVYVSIYYHADSTAKNALDSDETVTVNETEFGWQFDGPSEKNALIFYPGAKVEAEAYAPFLHLLAEEGVDVFLAKMPFRLAFFDMNSADDILDAYTYKNWYIGGHSLGGAMAASYAANNADRLRGLVLCAAYPVKELDGALTEISVYGSEDQVVNREKIIEGRDYAPESYTEHVIEGGNHAQFGSYGEQKGDGKASISPEDQWKEAVQVILKSIGQDR